MIAVPVSVVGTFSILYLLGFSLNTLSLFGLVLAIGIVVDDAIVVVENVERNIEEGLRRLPRRIRRCVRSPGRLSPLRWCCVRCSCRWRFLRGHRPVLQTVRGDHRHLDGDLGHQLADALPGAGGPAVKAARREERPPTRLIDRLFGWIFRPFNRFFLRSSNGYQGLVGKTLGRRGAVFAVYLLLLCAAGVMFKVVPGGFIPTRG